MESPPLTIKQLTQSVGGGLTPRMVRHYHRVGLLPQARRSPGNYRLYTEEDVQRLQRIVALKQQGFQLNHIQKLLTEAPADAPTPTLTDQLQQQYRKVIQQLAHLRQTATALEGLLGRDQSCQMGQATAIAQLRLLEVEAQDGLGSLEQLWQGLDAATHDHPEAFQESLQQLLPDLSDRSEIEVDLISQLVLASGDLSLVPFVHLSGGAIAVARQALSKGCQIVSDVPVVASALDQTRLTHLGCEGITLLNDSHITTVGEAEQAFWNHASWQAQWQELAQGCILVIGYAPSVLLSACKAIEQEQLQPSLVIGMPIGFSHAPAAKRRLKRSGVPYLTLEGSVGGGLLAAVALNALATSLIEKPDCHCYLTSSG